MPALTLGVPQARLDPPGSPASLEKPLTVGIGPVKSPAGAAITDAQAGKSGVLLYRTASSGAPEEIWNEKEQAWQAPPADPGALQPAPFQFKEGQPEPWQALVIAAGQKDTNNLDRFGRATGGFPAYRARAYFEATENGVIHKGTSGPSADWTYVSEADKARGGVIFDDARTPAKDATRARLFVKDPSLTAAAYVEVRATGGNEVEIARCDGGGNVIASVVIAGNGEIRLKPAGSAR